MTVDRSIPADRVTRDRKSAKCENSTIGKLEDLRGKTISPSTRGSVAHYLVLGALKKAGISPDEVKLAFLMPTDASAANEATADRIDSQAGRTTPSGRNQGPQRFITAVPPT